MLGIADQIAEEHLRRVKIKSDFISAACPFHKEGKESHPSFWINRHTGAWGCFTCDTKGSGLKWLLKGLGVSSLKIEAQLDDAERQSKKIRELEKVRSKKKARKDFKGDHVLPDALLGVFDWLSLDLVEQGFKKDLLREHDIGYDKRFDRITFPIRDLYGNLIGISGRATMIGAEPKYLVYSGMRVVDGKTLKGELGEWYPTYSSEGVRDHLWRMDKCWQRLQENKDGDEQLIIVEGYKAALWLVQNGWINTVALMGARMSQVQERIVRKLGLETFVMLDNNWAGRSGSTKICQRLGVSSFPVYEVSYPDHLDDDAQPDDLEEYELEEALCSARRIGGKTNVIRRMGRQSRGRQKKHPSQHW